MSLDTSKPKTQIVYMCGVAHDIEYDKDMLGSRAIFNSINAIKEGSPCWQQCGIVECELILKATIEPTAI